MEEQVIVVSDRGCGTKCCRILSLNAEQVGNIVPTGRVWLARDNPTWSAAELRAIANHLDGMGEGGPHA